MLRFLADMTGLFFSFASFPFCPFLLPKASATLVLYGIQEALLTVRQGGKGGPPIRRRRYLFVAWNGRVIDAVSKFWVDPPCRYATADVPHWDWQIWSAASHSCYFCTLLTPHTDKGRKHSSFLRKEGKDEEVNESSLLVELRTPLDSSPFDL
ncbi:hypothetical protein ACQKWADRAFT_276919 [Trichoderma austrokoningii]